MKKRLRVETKGQKIKRMLESYGGSAPIDEVAREVYGRCGREEKEKLVRLLSAFRARGTLKARVRYHRVVWAEEAVGD